MSGQSAAALPVAIVVRAALVQSETLWCVASAAASAVFRLFAVCSVNLAVCSSAHLSPALLPHFVLSSSLNGLDGGLVRVTEDTAKAVGGTLEPLNGAQGQCRQCTRCGLLKRRSSLSPAARVFPRYFDRSLHRWQGCLTFKTSKERTLARKGHASFRRVRPAPPCHDVPFVVVISSHNRGFVCPDTKLRDVNVFVASAGPHRE